METDKKEALIDALSLLAIPALFCLYGLSVAAALIVDRFAS